MDIQQLYAPIQAQAAANNAWSAEQAQRAMDYQEYMSNTAHQREVRDLKAAGLNPVLSAGGSGATTGTGHAANADSSNVDALYGIISKVLETQLAQASAMQVTASKIATNADTVKYPLYKPYGERKDKPIVSGASESEDVVPYNVTNKGYFELGIPGADTAIAALQDALYKSLGVSRSTSAKFLQTAAEVAQGLSDGELSKQEAAYLGLWTPALEKAGGLKGLLSNFIQVISSKGKKSK